MNYSDAEIDRAAKISYEFGCSFLWDNLKEMYKKRYREAMREALNTIQLSSLGTGGAVDDTKRLEWIISHKDYRVQGTNERGWFVLDCGNGLTFLTEKNHPSFRDAIDAGIAALAKGNDHGTG